MRLRRAQGTAWIDPKKEAERKARWFSERGGIRKIRDARVERVQNNRHQGLAAFIRNLNQDDDQPMKNEYLQAAGKPAVTISGKVREQFRAGLVLLDAASANITEAGSIFSQIDAAVWDELIADAPSPMRKTLSYVRRVGEGTMIPQLATASGEAAVRLRNFPVEDQLKLWREPVEMLAPGRIGRHAKYMRYATDMDGEEIKRAFERVGKSYRLRTYEEQKAYEAEKAAYVEPEKPSGVDRQGRWAIRGGKVYLAKAKVDAGLTKRDVETILKDLEEES